MGTEATPCALSADDYHADQIGDRPSLSASIVHTLCTTSPRHAWAQHPKLNPDFVRVEEEKFDVGTVAHELLLRGVNAVHVVEYDDWRKKDAQIERDAARAAGKIPLLAKHWAAVEAMVAAARGQFDAAPITPGLFVDGEPEQTIVWEDDGVLCRARADWLHNDAATIDDLKTTVRSANAKQWGRSTMCSIGADIQARFYQRGVKAHTGVEPAFRFVVLETRPPYAIGIVSLSAQAAALADEKIAWALATWKRCLETGDWPSYPLRVQLVDAPTFEEMRWLERDDDVREEAA